jgi:D-xylose transport system ATP-binding protein
VTASLSTRAQPILALRDIHKHYGAVHALRGANLTLHPGHITALVGDNGAGKSTLVKVLTGVVPADNGDITLDGRRVSFHAPRDAVSHGIAAVFQDLAVCGNLSVIENIFLGREDSRDRWLHPWVLRRTDPVRMERRARELLDSLHVRVPSLHAQVESLSGGQRQSVAIARALIGEPRVVVLDEPTAALSVAQTAEVLALVTRLKAAGLAVLLISHNLADVFSVADTVTVLRMGANVDDFEVGDSTQQEVVAAITGAEWGVK